MHGQELDSEILVGPFQLRIFYDFMQVNVFVNNINHFVAISVESCCFDVCSCAVLFPFESLLTIQTGVSKFPCRIPHSLTSSFVLVML